MSRWERSGGRPAWTPIRRLDAEAIEDVRELERRGSYRCDGSPRTGIPGELAGFEAAWKAGAFHHDSDGVLWPDCQEPS